MKVDFWVCNDDFWKKLKAKNVIFVVMTLKMVIFVLSQIQKMIIYFAKSADFFVFIFFPIWRTHTHNLQLRQYSHDWESCTVLKQRSPVRPRLAGTAVNGLIIVKLRLYVLEGGYLYIYTSPVSLTPRGSPLPLLWLIPSLDTVRYGEIKGNFILKFTWYINNVNVFN